MSALKNKKKYDVGIVGYWWSTNYGSVATYYALYNIIKELNLNPILIDRPESSSSGEGMDVFSRRFWNSYAEISESFNWGEENQYNNLCDTFIIGSDQVWTATSIKGYNYFFFLDFAGDDKKTLSYAASFGQHFNVGEDEKKTASRWLNRFNGVSVREFQAVDICKKDLEVNAEWVMDPVFLLNKVYWDEIAEKAERKTADILGEDKKYLFAYILNPSEEKRNIIKEVSAKLGLPVICMLDGRKGTFEDNNRILAIDNTIENAQEEEWIYFLKNAEYIVTDSQHGSAFSILFNKQFICCSDKKWGQARYESLFGLLGLKSRQCKTLKEIDDTKILSKKINYNSVNKILKRKVKTSYEWLLNNLGFDLETIKNNTVEKIVNEERCSGCSACSQICPKEAITIIKDEYGFLKPSVNVGKCVNCGLCLKKCINENPDYTKAEEPECYAMMASDEIRSISSSGGMFTVAAEYIIDNGGYVCGAAFKDDFSVEHIIINSKDQLWRLRGSKYMQSDVGDVYKRVKELILSGALVLFTGVPCQVAGLNTYLGKEYNNLYTIDLLCHGITSSEVFEKYRRDVLDGKKLTDLQFKAKKPWGWHAGVNAVFDDGSKYSVPLQSDSYFTAYLKSLSKNKGCEKCRSNALPRQGDLSIGDFWGIPKNDPEMHDRKGTSVVLASSEKGIKFFDTLKPFMKKWKSEPLSYAISNNPVIVKPYAMHKNHEDFFDNFFDLDFEAVTKGAFNNRLYDEQKLELLKTVPEKDHSLYYIAKAVAELSHGRKIVTWIKSPEFNRVLKTYFGLQVEFSVAKTPGAINNTSVFSIEKIAGRSSEYYIAVIEPNYSDELYKTLTDFGYIEEEDFIFRKHSPIIISDFDLAKGRYSDIYGNSIEGFSGVLTNVVFRGTNNHIIFDDKVKHTDNLTFDLTSDSYIRIGRECNFTDDVQFEVRGFSGSSKIIIAEKCKFMSTEFRLFNNLYESSVFINESCTFGRGLELHANSGKKIVIGRDCMFSRDIALWAGDGHSVFDVVSGKNINSVYNELPPQRNQIVLGEHVWIGDGAFLMHGTNIGNGSIVGAKSVVKGTFPNNCSIAGNPAKVIKNDVAWSREMSTSDIGKCGKTRYVARTHDYKPSISGLDVLVIGGTNNLGIYLVNNLVNLGNNVTIVSRGLHKDSFGINVNRVVVDISDSDSVKEKLSNKKYDVVFDNVSCGSMGVHNILSNVRCNKYIQLSSIAVYGRRLMDMKETEFNPYKYEASLENINLDFKSKLYGKGKRLAEAYAVQRYANSFPIVSVRIPYVAPTDRLLKFCKYIAQKLPMNIQNSSNYMSFVINEDVGDFLVWLAAQDYNGAINFSSNISLTLNDIISYISKKLNILPIINESGDLMPFREDSFTLDISKALSLGWINENSMDRFWSIVDHYIERVK